MDTHMDIDEPHRLIGISNHDWSRIACGDHRNHIIDPLYQHYNTNDLATKTPYHLYNLCYWIKLFCPTEWTMYGEYEFESLKCEVCERTIVQARDYTTLNMPAIRSLALYTIPPTYQIDPRYCFEYNTPPGHPKHFLFEVQNKNGGMPRIGQTKVIQDDLHLYHLVYKNNLMVEFKRLWTPLPLEHDRVQAWIDFQMDFHHNHYRGEIKILENHYGVKHIQNYYPNFSPTQDQLDHPKHAPCDGYQRGEIGAIQYIRKAQL